MAKPQDNDPYLSIPDQLAVSQLRVEELENALTTEKLRADTAEAALHDLRDEKLQREAQVDADLVEMHKGSEVLEVHPSAIAAHKAVGWVTV